MAEISKERLERARQEIAAAEAAKPQPAMTDELRAEVAQRREAMIAGQGHDYKRPRGEARAEADAAEVVEQAEDPAVQQAAAETLEQAESDGSTDERPDSPRPAPRNRRQ